MKGSLEIANKIESIISYANKKTVKDQKDGQLTGTLAFHRNSIIRELSRVEGVDEDYVLKIRGVDV